MPGPCGLFNESSLRRTLKGVTEASVAGDGDFNCARRSSWKGIGRMTVRFAFGDDGDNTRFIVGFELVFSQNKRAAIPPR